MARKFRISGGKLIPVDTDKDRDQRTDKKPDPRLRDAAEPDAGDAHAGDDSEPKRKQRRNSIKGQGVRARANGSAIWRVN